MAESTEGILGKVGKALTGVGAAVAGGPTTAEGSTLVSAMLSNMPAESQTVHAAIDKALDAIGGATERAAQTKGAAERKALHEVIRKFAGAVYGRPAEGIPLGGKSLRSLGNLAMKSLPELGRRNVGVVLAGSMEQMLGGKSGLPKLVEGTIVGQVLSKRAKSALAKAGASTTAALGATKAPGNLARLLAWVKRKPSVGGIAGIGAAMGVGALYDWGKGQREEGALAQRILKEGPGIVEQTQQRIAEADPGIMRGLANMAQRDPRAAMALAQQYAQLKRELPRGAVAFRMRPKAPGGPVGQEGMLTPEMAALLGQ